MREDLVTHHKHQIAVEIFKYRQTKWTTQEVAAWCCGISKHTYKAIENRHGQTRHYQIDSLIRVLDALDLEIQIVKKSRAT